MDYGIGEYENGKSLENELKVNLYMICKTNVHADSFNQKECKI